MILSSLKTPQAREQISGDTIADDILTAAYNLGVDIRHHIAHSNLELFQHDPDIDEMLAKAIHEAVMAERERCASVADWYSQASVNAEWTEEARGAGYYACADVARDIRFPKPVKDPSPQASDADDDLPF